MKVSRNCFTGILEDYIVVKVDGATPKKGGLVRGHNRPIHGSGAIYFLGGI